MPDAFTVEHCKEITLLAARYRLPAVYPFRFIAELGGLLSYGNNRLDNFRSAATYADRILKGAKPSELRIDYRWAAVNAEAMERFAKADAEYTFVEALLSTAKRCGPLATSRSIWSRRSSGEPG
jgi:hypothetical protein